MAAIAGIGDDLAEADADGVLDCRDDGGQRVAVIRIAGQRLDMGDELAAAAALQRGGDGDLDAELVGLVGFALANALDLRSVQGIHFLAPLALALIPDAPGQRQRQGKTCISPGRPTSVRVMSRITAPSMVRRRLSCRLARLNLCGCQPFCKESIELLGVGSSADLCQACLRCGRSHAAGPVW